MKNLFSFAVLGLILCLYSCDGSKDNNKTDENLVTSEDVNYMMLSDSASLRKVYDMVVAKLDTNIQYVDKVDISISDPKMDSHTDKTSLSLHLTYMNPNNNNKLRECSYYSSSGKWDCSKTVTVELISGDPEKFNLKDNLLDLRGLTFEKLNSLVQKAFVKYKDDNKFSFQYVSAIVITEYASDRQPMIHINMRGQLKANEMKKNESVDIPLKNVLK